ncbi:MAG: TraB/GumN family protein [Parafilimonas sp.]
MSKKLFGCTLALLFACLQMLSAQKLPSTLLWRISGNGFQKPSYLFGTLHLTDERIFNLGDSVYHAIEKADGFAMEIDPEQFTPFVIDEAKKKTMETIRLKDMMQKDEYKKYGRILAKKLGKNADEITTADILHEKNKWIQESYSTGRMQSFLDVYLFDIARRQGKWTGGVEDLEDQENLFDLVDKSDIQDVAMSDDAQNAAATKSMTAFLIKTYIDNNLNAIDSFSNAGDSTFKDALLVKRNKKMALRMDSLGKERSMVFAVGAAHLPGEEGLIAL